MSGLTLICLAAGMLLGSAVPAAAQIGKLKQRVKDKVTRHESPQPAAQNGGIPARPEIMDDPYQPKYMVPITAVSVDQIITGLRAERAERARLLTDPSTDPGVVALWKQQDRKPICDSVQAERDSTQARLGREYQKESAAIINDRDHAEAHFQKSQDVQQQISDAQADAQRHPCELGPPPPTDQAYSLALDQVGWRLDNIGARAAGLTWHQYVYLRVRVLFVALRDDQHPGFHAGVDYTNDGTWKDFKGFSADELALIRARKPVLLKLARRDFDWEGGERSHSVVQ